MLKIPHFALFYLLPLFVLLSCIFDFSLSENAFADSPSFGHQEIRDDTLDIIDMCLDSSKEVDPRKCTNIRVENQPIESNQSIDIRAVDYFSTRNILNTTIWLVSNVSENTLDPIFISNYGAYIDADSNQKTGWQGIDYQIEISENEGKWNITHYQFSSLGDVRFLKGPENHTDSIVKDAKYIDLDVMLDYLGLPENYRVMFYAEKLTKDKSCNPESERTCKSTSWKTDFTSWIEIPKQKLNLTSTPSPITLRVEGKDSFGILLISETGITPEVSSFNVKDPPSDLELQFFSKANSSNKNPGVLEITTSKDAMIGTYIVPILAELTKKSTIPPLDPSSEILNIGNEVEEVNLPISVLRKTNTAEDLIAFMKDYGVIIGLIAGGAASQLWTWGFDKLKKRQEEKKG